MGAAGVKRLLSAVLTFTLVACAGSPKRATAPAAPAATYGPAPSAVPAPPPEPRPASDQCGLSELKGVVGRSRLDIPIPLEPGRRRVLCDTCPRSPEIVPGRQTVLFDARTGLVTAASCG